MLWDSTDDWTGNLIFYFHYGPSWWDRFLERLVATKTHGPYVHVGFIIGRGTINPDGSFTESLRGRWVVISAQSNGINYSYLPFSKGTQYSLYSPEWRSVTIRTLNIDPNDPDKKIIALDRARVEEALNWAKRHIHVTYGWVDNVTQSVDILWPNNPLPVVIQPDHYNCSNFTAEFLNQCGIWTPFPYPYKVSPNDLAEWCGLLPKRHIILKRILT